MKGNEYYKLKIKGFRYKSLSDPKYIKDRDESIQSLIDDKEGIMEQKLEEWIENGNKYPEIMNKFNRYLEKKENNVVINKIKNEIKLLLFNNRDLIS